jgi:hypothetical protein
VRVAVYPEKKHFTPGWFGVVWGDFFLFNNDECNGSALKNNNFISQIFNEFSMSLHTTLNVTLTSFIIQQFLQFKNKGHHRYIIIIDIILARRIITAARGVCCTDMIIYYV